MEQQSKLFPLILNEENLERMMYSLIYCIAAYATQIFTRHATNGKIQYTRWYRVMKLWVDSCRECSNCKKGLEQYCKKGPVGTYNAYEKDGKTPTYGGYSKQIVVHEDFVLHVPGELPLETVAPLLCAGITTYSPLRHW